jgi:hypothetical protein
MLAALLILGLLIMLLKDIGAITLSHDWTVFVAAACLAIALAAGVREIRR